MATLLIPEAQVLPRTQTPISLQASARLLSSAFDTLLGRPPTKNEAAFLQAQLWLETGSGKKCTQHNIGNIIGTASWVQNGGAIWRPPWFDLKSVQAMTESASKTRLLRLHTEMNAGRAPSSFRAYPSFEAGYNDYVSLLKRRFPIIIEAAASGEPEEFALAIQSSGYCPDCNPNLTKTTLESLASQIVLSGVFDALGGSADQLPLDMTPEELFGLLRPESERSSFGEQGKRLGVYDLPTLREYSNSVGVNIWQRLLNIARMNWNMPPVTVDGDFGPETRRATLDFQTRKALKPDGVVGRQTWSAAP